MASKIAEGPEQSVGRAAALLRLVAAHGSAGARLLDLATESGMTRPTVHRILRRLCEERLLAQDAASRRYIMGSLMFELGLAARTPIRHLNRMRPDLDALAQSTGDTVYLVLRAGDESVCLNVSVGSFPIRISTFEVGARRPLGTGAGGMALLAGMPQDEASAVIERIADRLLRVGIDEAQMQERLRQVRLHGAISHGTMTEGISGIAVAVPVQVGSPYLAISVGTISSRMSDARIKVLWKGLRTTARRLAAIAASVN